ncbi:hypothetical protein FALCPG4_017840 [Fusarium falciforme]
MDMPSPEGISMLGEVGKCGIAAMSISSSDSSSDSSDSRSVKTPDDFDFDELVAHNIKACAALAPTLDSTAPTVSRSDQRRMLIELEAIKSWGNETERWYTLRPIVEDRLDAYLGTFIGPKDTPYEGGIFHVRFSLKEGYPFTPPEMWFLTKILHPNVDTRGTICMDLDWSPSLTLEVLLASAASLLDTPDWWDPMPDGLVAALGNDAEKFDEMARKWTKDFATGELVRPGDRIDGFCNTTDSVPGWAKPIMWARKRLNPNAFGLFKR